MTFKMLCNKKIDTLKVSISLIYNFKLILSAVL